MSTDFGTTVNGWLLDLGQIKTNYEAVIRTPATTQVPAANATPSASIGGFSMMQIGVGVVIVVVLAIAIKKVL